MPRLSFLSVKSACLSLSIHGLILAGLIGLPHDIAPRPALPVGTITVDLAASPVPGGKTGPKVDRHKQSGGINFGWTQKASGQEEKRPENKPAASATSKGNSPQTKTAPPQGSQPQRAGRAPTNLSGQSGNHVVSSMSAGHGAKRGQGSRFAPKFSPGSSANPPPLYPLKARRKGLEGTVLLSVTVSKAGKAESISLIRSSGHRLLDESARKAVKKWRFKPAEENGIARKGSVQIPFTFRLSEAL